MLDLEDAVAPDDKTQARLNVIDALGIVHADAIATACPGRMEAMVFGVADYAVSMQSHTTSIGGANPDYAVLTDANGSGRESHRGDHWHYALSRIAVSCRAHGLCPIDGPFVDIMTPRAPVGAGQPRPR